MHLMSGWQEYHRNLIKGIHANQSMRSFQLKVTKDCSRPEASKVEVRKTTSDASALATVWVCFRTPAAAASSVRGWRGTGGRT